MHFIVKKPVDYFTETCAFFSRTRENGLNIHISNPFISQGAHRALIDFTLSNARRFYSSMGNPLAVKGETRGILNAHFKFCCSIVVDVTNDKLSASRIVR